MADSKQNDLVYLDEIHQQQTDAITQSAAQAVGQPLSINRVVPLADTTPLSQSGQFQIPAHMPQVVAEPEEEHVKKDPGLDEFMLGMKGQPRSTHAVKFLTEKMTWLSKKHGGGVRLKK